ncbi:Uncharacterised protein [Enterobacter hormaechei]|nr:Uncharacterised protein [Enterobacter hormaechei]
MPGELDITDQRLHHIIRRGHQLQLIAFYPSNPLAAFAQLEQRCGHATVLFSEDMLAGFKVGKPFRRGGPHGAGAFGAAFTQMKFTEREIGDDAHQRQNVDNQKPGHGGRYRSAFHQNAQRHPGN